jgi:hypothetical protein
MFYDSPKQAVDSEPACQSLIFMSIATRGPPLQRDRVLVPFHSIVLSITQPIRLKQYALNTCLCKYWDPVAATSKHINDILTHPTFLITHGPAVLVGYPCQDLGPFSISALVNLPVIVRTQAQSQSIMNLSMSFQTGACS